MENPEKLDNLWEEVNAQCCKEASLKDMSAWVEAADCYCGFYKDCAVDHSTC